MPTDSPKNPRLRALPKGENFTLITGTTLNPVFWSIATRTPQISWEETDATLNRFWIKLLTKLSESEIQSALDELLDLGVIERIEFA